MSEPTTGSNLNVENLSAELWRERSLLEGLLYKFTTMKLLVTNGESRWVGRCSSEIETLKNQLTVCQLNIDMLALATAGDWGEDTPSSPTLRELIEIASRHDGPWAGILQEHRDAIVDLSDDIKAIAEVNSRLVKAASISLQDAGQQSAPVTYNASGSAAAPSGLGASLLDRSS